MPDANERPISALFFAFADWMIASGNKDVAKQPQPWRGELKTDDDVLKLAFNASGKEADGVPMYSLKIESTTYLAIGIIKPFGGLAGGFSEDKLIKDFETAKGSIHA